MKIVLALCLETLVVIADGMIKQATRCHSKTLLIAGAATIFAALTPGWYWLLKHVDLIVLSLWLGAAYCGLQVVVGAVLFNEPLTGRRWIALILVVAAIVSAE